VAVNSSFASQVLSGLYAIIIIVIGLVLSLATAFTHQLGQESYYLEVRYDMLTNSTVLHLLLMLINCFNVKN